MPGGTEVVGQQKIEESRGANLKDVLDFVPGVFVRPRFGAADESQISIRGSGLRNNFHLRGVNVLIDGFPYGNADGFGDFESLELLTTKRIEVYKGANALRFGGYTLGGAINLVTKTGYDAGLIELRSEAGSFGFLKNYVGTGQVYGPFDLYVGLSRHGARRLPRAQRPDPAPRLRDLGYGSPGARRCASTSATCENEENLPGALTKQEMDQNPRQRNPTMQRISRRSATTTTPAAP